MRLEHELQTLPAGWAGPRKWKRLLPALSEFLRTHLEPLRAQIVSAKARLAALNEQVEALVTEAKLPKGLGRLTLSLVDGKVCEGPVQASQSPGQLYRLLSQRTQQRPPPAPGQVFTAMEQTCPRAAHRGGLAPVALPAAVACPPQTHRPHDRRHRLAQKDRRGFRHVNWPWICGAGAPDGPVSPNWDSSTTNP